MLPPINPPLSTPNFSIAEVTETKTFSVALQESIEHWTFQAENLPKAEKAALLSIIKRLASSISLKINTLSKTCSSSVMKTNFENSLAQLNESAHVFYQSKQSFIEEQKKVEQQMLACTQDIQGLAIPKLSSSQTLTKETKPLYKEILETHIPVATTQLALRPYNKRELANSQKFKTEDNKKVNFTDIWMVMQRNQMMEEMNNVIIASNIIKLLDRAKNIVIRKGLETVCYSNPQIHRACRKTKKKLIDGGYFLIKQIPQEVKDLINQYFTQLDEMHKKATLRDAERNATMYGIPRNVTIESREAFISVSKKTVDLFFGIHLKDIFKHSKLASHQGKFQLLFDVVTSEPLNSDGNDSPEILPLNLERHKHPAIRALEADLPEWRIQGIENYLLLKNLSL